VGTDADVEAQAQAEAPKKAAPREEERDM